MSKPQKKLLITAGPTHEAIDPVRYLANRSSGKMGFALAARAATRGWDVVLVAGPVGLSTPEGVRRIDVTSACEMYAAVADAIHGCDIAILAAAVADFRPVRASTEKIKKSAAPTLVLELEKNPDILGSMRHVFGFTGTLVGFAAETENILIHAKDKLRRKHCDLLVANDVSRNDIGFGSEANQVTLLFADGRPHQEVARMPKEQVADIILDQAASITPQTGD